MAGGWGGSSESSSSPQACRCLPLRPSFPRKQMVDQTSQALRSPRVWRGARAPGPLPAVRGDRPHPALRCSGSPPPLPTPPPPRAGPGRQRGPATITRDFLFFFCWFQAFFCLSENETNTPCASPPPDTHAHRQSCTRAPGLPAAVSGAGPFLHKQPRAGPSRERAARCPAPDRFLAPLPAARCPPPRRSARRPAGPSAGGTPRPGTPRRARAEAARPRTTPGPGAEAQVSPERAQLLRIRWVPRGAARAPRGREPSPARPWAAGAE